MYQTNSNIGSTFWILKIESEIVLDEIIIFQLKRCCLVKLPTAIKLPLKSCRVKKLGFRKIRDI